MMRNLNQPHDADLLSPTAFIIEINDIPVPQLELNLNGSDPQVEPFHKCFRDDAAKTSSRQEKKRLAGVRSRQKKKKYVQDLEQRVKMLSAEVEKYESQVSKCKDQLVEAIRISNSVELL